MRNRGPERSLGGLMAATGLMAVVCLTLRYPYGASFPLLIAVALLTTAAGFVAQLGHRPFACGFSAVGLAFLFLLSASHPSKWPGLGALARAISVPWEIEGGRNGPKLVLYDTADFAAVVYLWCSLLLAVLGGLAARRLWNLWHRAGASGP